MAECAGGCRGERRWAGAAAIRGVDGVVEGWSGSGGSVPAGGVIIDLKLKVYTFFQFKFKTYG